MANADSNGVLRLFSGSSSTGLAKSVSEMLGIRLSDVTIKRFADGELNILINESVRGADVYLIQSTGTPVNENVMELVLTLDALKRASAGRITVVVPYYGYARQDRLVGRSPISAKLVADLIVASGADAFVSVDLHARSIQGYFNIPIDDLTAMPVLAEYFRKLIGGNPAEECVVVSPDVGGVKRARDFARLLNCPLAIIDKQRVKTGVKDAYTGKAEVFVVIGEVVGKTAILVDDMVDTAGSITAGASALVEKGAKQVYAAATHGVLSPPAYERIAASPIKELVVTDSLMLKPGAPSNLKQASLAPLISDVIKRLHSKESVSGVYGSRL